MATKDMPFLKFFPRDWMSDEKLRLCSLPARGMWFEILCLMHMNTRRRGYLDHAAGGPVPLPQLARALGVSEGEAREWVGELESAGVFSRDECGVIYSRRMVEDERFRAACAKAGKASARNPRTRAGGGRFGGSAKPAAERTPNGARNDSPNEHRTERGTTHRTNTEPSEVRVQRTEERQEEPPRPPAKPGGTAGELAPIPLDTLGLDTPAFRDAWANWLRLKPGAKLKPPAQARQLARLAEIGPAAAVRCIEHSLMNQYQGLFPEKFAPRAPGRAAGADRAAVAEARALAQVREAMAECLPGFGPRFDDSG